MRREVGPSIQLTNCRETLAHADAVTIPAGASEVTSRTPDRPRAEGVGGGEGVGPGAGVEVAVPITVADVGPLLGAPAPGRPVHGVGIGVDELQELGLSIMDGAVIA
ncbi:MAG: hypothetical protein J0I49_29975 [Pseudonocardia sp.]|nr:hypothetical protein [Pseudonocardia sp.]